MKTTTKKRSAKKTPTNKSLKFYDVKGRKSFKSSSYVYKVKGKTKFAVATAPSGIKAWRIIGRV